MFTYLQSLNWLWLLPILVAVIIIQHLRTRRRLDTIAGPNAQRAFLSTTNDALGFLRWTMIIAGTALVIVALAGPAWDPIEEKVMRQGRDVVFLVDVSKSMLAEDLRPNRLERAKADIQECVDALNGDRVGLVAFAGTSAILCPLTQDYGFFRMMLAELSTDAVTRGGTNIGDALRTVQKKVFDEQQRLGRDIILITDGEDHDSMPVEAAKAIGQDGIRLLAIGIGDDKNGTLLQIPDGKGGKSVLRYQGEPVRSRLDSETLRAMTSATPGGIYLPVATNAFNLKETYKTLVDSAEKHQLEEEHIEHLQPKYQLFLLPAMILLALAILLPTGKKPSPGMLAAMALLLCASSLKADDFALGTQALKDGDFSAAIQHYNACREKLGDDIPPALDYNTALAQYGQGDFTNAQASLRSAIEKNGLSKKPNEQLDEKARLALANTQFHVAENATNQAEQSKNPEPLQTAKNAIEETLQIYQNTTSGKPFQDAIANNVVLAEELKKRIEELEKELKQQQQNQDSQQQQEQDSQQQNQDSQQQQSQDSQQQQSQDSQQQQSQDSQQQQSQDSQQQQSQDSQQQQNQDSQQQNQDSQQQQSQDSQQQEQDSQQQSQDSQQQASSKEENATPQQKAVQSQAAEKEDDSQEKAEPLPAELQQIIDGEKRHRMRQRMNSTKQNPVDKDW